MKHLVVAYLLIAGISPLASQAQLNNGGLYAFFGVDADTRSNYLKYGLVTGSQPSDDWFSSGAPGKNVIDISNAAIYLAQLKSGANLSFSKRMSQLLYAKVNGRIWLDAAYGRDYTAAASLKDSTVFTISAKNGDNPTNWQGGVAGTPAKNDLVDVYAHMRRDGIDVHDSLWFFSGVSTYATNGNSYFDVELYKNSFGYNQAAGTFSSAGTAAGHTEWVFDAAGNLIQTGDMIVAVSFTPGTVPVIDVRIWVSQSTFNTWYGGAASPKYFNFNGAWSSTLGTYGYASIVSKAGTTAFGAGISNYSATTTADTTYATPWGTAVNMVGWSTQYQTQQLIEVGLNLTRIGVDPAMYSTLNPCQSTFSNIFFKSRSSSSFSSNLQDFVAPLTFLRPPVMDYSEVPDTLRCNHPVAKITLTNNSTAGFYTWQTLGGGNISGANADSSQLNITKPGTYIVSSSPAEGCPPARVDTIIIPIDTFPPVSSALAGLSGGNLDMFGGNVVASNYPTPFGGSQGLTFSWTGPGGFTSTGQNPVTDTVWGNYSLTVTEKRNGCTATATADVESSMFTALLINTIQLKGSVTEQAIALDWNVNDKTIDHSFVVERSDGNHGYQAIAAVMNPDNSGVSIAGSFSFVDEQPLGGNNYYRVRVTTNSGQVFYSKTILVAMDPSTVSKIYLAGTAGTGQKSLVVSTSHASQGVLVYYSVAGEIVEKKAISLAGGSNIIPIADMPRSTIRVLALWINGRMAWSQKVLF